jgi:ATP-dependent 26S proteasome regulatory subunit
MKTLRIPAWLRTLLERYHSGASHLFLLHGNVRDLQPFGREHVPLREGLRRLTAQRPIVLSYDVSAGFAFPDAAREKAFRKALGLKSMPLPVDPPRALALIDALLTSDRAQPGSVAVILDYAHSLVPADGGSSVERQSITTLARWASDQGVASRRPLVTLIAPSASEVSGEIFAGAAGAETLPVPRPDLTARAAFLVEARARRPALRWDMETPQVAAETGGLSLEQIEDILQRAEGSASALDRAAIVARKIELLRQEYGEVLEILEPKHDLSAVGGLEHAVRELKEIADIMRRGLFSAAPMGIVLMGPPGTGKSYLSECFAKECGLLCVRFRPLRQMYVGQSERNQEKGFAAIRALSPVIVIVDESDQAEGGSRDQGGGDSGVTERMRGAAFNFWGDNSLRGKVLRIDITNRIDLIDAAMRRSGRTDVKIPILMPDEAARAQIFEVTLRKHRIPSAVKDFQALARRTAGFTGSDVELAVTTAWRFALRDGATALTDAHLAQALDDLLPTLRDQATIDRMTLLALDECRNKRLLPRNAEAIRTEIEERRAGRSPEAV